MGTLIAILVILPVMGWTITSGRVYRELHADAKERPNGFAAKLSRWEMVRYSMRVGASHLFQITRGAVAYAVTFAWSRCVVTPLARLRARRGGGGQAAAPTALRPDPADPADPAGRGGRGGPSRGPGPAGPAPAATPDTVRDVPSLRDDLRATPPDPAVIGQQDVPALWVQLCTAIAGFIPENEAAELDTVRGWSAGLLHFSQAILAHADNLTGVWNLSPPVIAGMIEIADGAMDASLMVAAHNQRMVAEYAATRNAVADGTPLPNNAAQWFGDGAAA